MSKRNKRNRATLERAQQPYPQGGTVIPNALIQQFMALIQQQSKQQSGQNAFSPGKPLDPQNVNPGGLPIAFRYPVAYNVSGIDRSLGSPDIAPFAQLRNLADLYEGIQLCEKVWLDLIPRLQLKITLRPELVSDKNTDDKYQKQIAAYQAFFEKPDGVNDLHSWLRIAITEQLQLDALYIHKQKTRGKQLQALNIIAGDTMKVLLDDWGRVMGYQQFPWGIPGEIFTPDQMLYFRESPRANTPYGKSRVERILMRVNQALRKEKKDLAHFTEGNQPFAMMEVPETSQWTPDQIEAFEVMWNSLIAGNVQQQVRVKFTQPGMKYTPLEQYQLLSDFDQFILNIATAAYGISLADLSFTGDIHKSSDDGQQNMLGRRTIYPIVGMYGMLLTSVLRDDFKDPRFVVTFTGFEEAEDTNAQSETYSRLTQAGILGLSNAAKLMKLPEDPNAPHIGRVVMTKDGPIFLDDMASDVMRNAAAKAKLTQLQQSGVAPATVQGQQQLAQAQLGGGAPQETEGEQGTNEKASQKTSTQSGKASDAASKAGNGSTHNRELMADEQTTPQLDDHGYEREIYDDLRKWRSRVIGQEEEQHTGVMVAFFLEPKVAEQLALPSGEPASDLHITLAFLGDRSDLADPQRLKSAVATFAAHAEPLQGKISGVGRFTSVPDDEPTPVYASADIPGLPAWREALIQALELAECPVDGTHGYTPHITLAYIEADAPMPVEHQPDLPLSLDTVWLAIGEEHFVFSLGTNHRPQAVRASERAVFEDLRRWRGRALDDVKAGKPFRTFHSTYIPHAMYYEVLDGLQRCTVANQVRVLFERVKGGALETGAWQNTDPDVQKQLRALQDQGVTHVAWNTAHITQGQYEGLTGAGEQAIGTTCDVCEGNTGMVVPLGSPFPSGAILPPQHPNCACTVTGVTDLKRYNENHDARGRFAAGGGGGSSSNDSGGGSGGGGGGGAHQGGKSKAAQLRAMEKEMAAKHPDTHFDFTGCDPAIMGPACQQLDLLMSKYPEVGKSLAYVGTGKNAPPGYGADRMPAGSMACCASRMTGTTPYSSMILNTKYFGDVAATEAEFRINAITGWFANGSKTGKMQYIITHEFGHAVDAYLNTAGTGQGAGKVYDVSTKLWEFKNNNTRMGNTVSGYARQGGPIEQWAEAFASLHFAPPAQQAPYTKRVGALLDKLLPGGSSMSWQSHG